MSREADMVRSVIDGTEYDKTPQSRNEAIVKSIIDNTPYEATPQSEMEKLLLELKTKGVGGGDSYFKALTDVENTKSVSTITVISEDN